MEWFTHTHTGVRSTALTLHRFLAASPTVPLHYDRWQLLFTHILQKSKGAVSGAGTSLTLVFKDLDVVVLLFPTTDDAVAIEEVIDRSAVVGTLCFCVQQVGR